MAQQQALNTGGGANPSSGSNAPEFVGGELNPKTGAITPASTAQANVAPPPKLPTTQLGKLNAPTSGLPAVAGSYVGSAIGGEFGAQVSGGASLSSAASSTLSNLGTVLKEPLTSTSGGFDFGGAVRDLFTSGAPNAPHGTFERSMINQIAACRNQMSASRPLFP
jgi:hypothetical protein